MVVINFFVECGVIKIFEWLCLMILGILLMCEVMIGFLVVIVFRII